MTKKNGFKEPKIVNLGRNKFVIVKEDGGRKLYLNLMGKWVKNPQPYKTSGVAKSHLLAWSLKTL